MSTPENTFKNRKLSDEVRGVVDGNEYLSIEVGLFTYLGAIEGHISNNKCLVFRPKNP